MRGKVAIGYDIICSYAIISDARVETIGIYALTIGRPSVLSVMCVR